MAEVLELEDSNVSVVKDDKLILQKIVVKENPLSEFFGMWADRDIDATTLRKQAWGIEN